MSLFGASSTPSTGGGLFGSSTPSFNLNTGGSLFGGSTPAAGGGMFGQPASTATPSGSLFGSGTPATGGGLFGGASSGGLFGSSTPAFSSAALSTPSLFGSSTPATGSSLFGGTATGGLFGQQALSGTPGMFGQPASQQSMFGGASAGSLFPTPAQPQQQMQFGGQLTTQMAPTAPLTTNLPDREIQAIVEAYEENPSNPKYRFRHLFLSVVDPSLRGKPQAVSDLAWAESMNAIAGMEVQYRDKLWPELAQGFKDLSNRLRIQDQVLQEDSARLRATEGAVKQLQRHFEAETASWVQRLRQKEQHLQKRLLRVMRILEALEGRAHPGRPLTRAESQLADKLRALAQQMESPSADLPRRINSLLSASRMSHGVAGGGLGGLLVGGKIDERSLAEMQEVLRQETEAIKSLAAVLKRDARDAEIIASDGVERGVNTGSTSRLSSAGWHDSGGAHLNTRTPGRLLQ